MFRECVDRSKHKHIPLFPFEYSRTLLQAKFEYALTTTFLISGYSGSESPYGVGIWVKFRFRNEEILENVRETIVYAKSEWFSDEKLPFDEVTDRRWRTRGFIPVGSRSRWKNNREIALISLTRSGITFNYLVCFAETAIWLFKIRVTIIQ